MAVTAASVEEGEQLDALRTLHDAFVSERPAWVERVEVSYVALDVLRTFGDRPTGRVAVICPGEPLHIRNAGFEFTLDWRSVCTQGETIFGPPPLELGPEVSRDAYRRAVEALLKEKALLTFRKLRASRLHVPRSRSRLGRARRFRLRRVVWASSPRAV
jgi:hypothetical protein